MRMAVLSTSRAPLIVTSGSDTNASVQAGRRRVRKLERSCRRTKSGTTESPSTQPDSIVRTKPHAAAQWAISVVDGGCPSPSQSTNSRSPRTTGLTSAALSKSAAPGTGRRPEGSTRPDPWVKSFSSNRGSCGTGAVQRAADDGHPAGLEVTAHVARTLPQSHRICSTSTRGNRL
jgi:hypothetical protein